MMYEGGKARGVRYKEVSGIRCQVREAQGKRHKAVGVRHQVSGVRCQGPSVKFFAELSDFFAVLCVTAISQRTAKESQRAAK